MECTQWRTFECSTLDPEEYSNTYLSKHEVQFYTWSQYQGMLRDPKPSLQLNMGSFLAVPNPRDVFTLRLNGQLPDIEFTIQSLSRSFSMSDPHTSWGKFSPPS